MADLEKFVQCSNASDSCYLSDVRSDGECISTSLLNGSHGLVRCVPIQVHNSHCRFKRGQFLKQNCTKLPNKIFIVDFTYRELLELRTNCTLHDQCQIHHLKTVVVRSHLNETNIYCSSRNSMYLSQQQLSRPNVQRKRRHIVHQQLLEFDEGIV